MIENYDSFNHGQMHSKLWLCEKIEPLIPQNPSIAILGSWHNLLGLMLLIRKPNAYQHILGIDKNPEAKQIADKICEGFMMRDNVVIQNKIADVNYYNLSGYNVVINCSIEHIEGSQWFNNIDNNSLICFQTSNVVNKEPLWDIVNPCYSLDEFANRYPLSQTLFVGEKQLVYENWGYKRFMVIGIK